MHAVPGTPVRILGVNDAVHRMVLRERVARGRYRLWLDGHRYDAEALDSRARAIRDMQASVAKPRGPAPAPRAHAWAHRAAARAARRHGRCRRLGSW